MFVKKKLHIELEPTKLKQCFDPYFCFMQYISIVMQSKDVLESALNTSVAVRLFRNFSVPRNVIIYLINVSIIPLLLKHTHMFCEGCFHLDLACYKNLDFSLIQVM